MDVPANYSGFFEGAEKLLEVWFANSKETADRGDLRRVPLESWQSILKLVKCEIISLQRHDQIDAYVLRYAAVD